MSTSGVIEDGVHRIPVRVYYEDTDAGGIVYHANHLKFAERARTEMLRCLGLDHSTLRQRFGLTFAVRRCLADFRVPARLDDRLEVETRVARLGGASLDLIQNILGQDILNQTRLLVRLELRLALLDGSLRAARLPRELATMLEPVRERQGSATLKRVVQRLTVTAEAALGPTSWNRASSAPRDRWSWPLDILFMGKAG
jgi:acyl-CoA thioester hydrolase